MRTSGVDRSVSLGVRGRGKLFGLFATALMVSSLSLVVGTATASTRQQTNAAHAKKPVVGGSIEIAQAGLSWADLDPGVSPTAASDASLEDAIFDSLFNLNPKGAVLPGLATGYRYSADRMTVTIFLRHHVTFSDGTPFNAAAVAWNLSRDDASVCQCYTGISAQSSVTTSGNYTVIVHLSRPSSAYIDALALGGGAAFMVSPTAFMSEGAAAFQTQPVGAGPFTVSQNIVNSEIVLTKNPHYWDRPKPYLNQITIISTGSDATTLAAVESHTAQLGVTADFPTIVQAKRNKHLQIFQEPPVTANWIEINTISGPFAGSAGLVAREALAEAINQKSIINNLTLGIALPTCSMWAQGELGWPGRKCQGYVGYNPTDAAAKVATLTNAQKNFTYFDLATVTPAIAVRNEALQTMWDAVGFNVTIKQYSHTQAIGLFNSGNFTATLGTYGGTFDPADGVALRIFYPTGLNDAYDSPTVNALLNQASETFNTAQRAALYKQVQARVNEDVANIPLYQTVTDLVSTPLMRGFEAIPVVQYANLWLA